MMRIEGCAAIITGASSGIGQAAAREFADQQVNVVLASRNRDRLEALALDLVALPGRTLVVPTDVIDRLAVEALVRKTAEEFGSVDILVNNAGAGLFAPIAGGNPENMRRLFDVNFWGAINCIQAAVPYMQAQRNGHIVNVASVAAKLSPPYMGIYSATKFALSAVSDALRSELADSGIGVSTIYPGLTSTSFMENMTQELEVPSLPPLARFVDPSVVGHRISQAIRFGFRDAYISPEDIAAVALNTIAPQIVDWTMRVFMGRPPALDAPEIELPRSGLRRREADAEPSEPA
jgi:short-subunit dehydrogenase